MEDEEELQPSDESDKEDDEDADEEEDEEIWDIPHKELGWEAEMFGPAQWEMDQLKNELD